MSGCRKKIKARLKVRKGECCSVWLWSGWIQLNESMVGLERPMSLLVSMWCKIGEVCKEKETMG